MAAMKLPLRVVFRLQKPVFQSLNPLNAGLVDDWGYDNFIPSRAKARVMPLSWLIVNRVS